MRRRRVSLGNHGCKQVARERGRHEFERFELGDIDQRREENRINSSEK